VLLGVGGRQDGLALGSVFTIAFFSGGGFGLYEQGLRSRLLTLFIVTVRTALSFPTTALQIIATHSRVVGDISPHITYGLGMDVGTRAALPTSAGPNVEDAQPISVFFFFFFLLLFFFLFFFFVCFFFLLFVVLVGKEEVVGGGGAEEIHLLVERRGREGQRRQQIGLGSI
jgi:hypothetical protein